MHSSDSLCIVRARTVVSIILASTRVIMNFWYAYYSREYAYSTTPSTRVEVPLASMHTTARTTNKRVRARNLLGW